ncbi:hypothetical protein [Taibaiella chishuiensis]|uniref:Lipoprotein n=1 Tax=Taibaiella chishuiensis TaxID=1434707 RepID=A0A2P8CV21_9BACT|nr:hypothetical protein [Taibaiella chishuiensis]PSK88821.1 hypothetical protein B0I18_11432 [Taibaiella chishuiensis]
MKKARLLLTASMLTIAGFASVTLTSCSKDDKICNEGYEGSNCDVEVRTKFLGQWSAQDRKEDGTQLPAYTANVVKNPSSISKMNIGGFSGIPSNGGFAADVIVSASGTTFTIPPQEPDADGFSVEGNGFINSAGNSITVNYNITKISTGQVNKYTGTWTK